jgi:hypothetical protein
MLPFDFSRITDELKAQRDILDRMDQFFINRTGKLRKAAGDIDQFFRRNNLHVVIIGNPHSGGDGDYMYSEAVSMKVVCKCMYFGNQDNESLKNNLYSDWDNTIAEVHNIHIDLVGVKFFENHAVEIHLLVP